MFRGAIAVALIGVAIPIALAQSDPIAARQALMKANGRQAKLGSDMIRGKVSFDLAKAKAVFDSFIDAANKMPNLFPEDSKTGRDTSASPEIWTHLDDVRARFARLAADAKTAQEATKDVQSFRAGYRKISEECDSCHEHYRLKNS